MLAKCWLLLFEMRELKLEKTVISLSGLNFKAEEIVSVESKKPALSFIEDFIVWFPFTATFITIVVVLAQIEHSSEPIIGDAITRSDIPKDSALIIVTIGILIARWVAIMMEKKSAQLVVNLRGGKKVRSSRMHPDAAFLAKNYLIDVMKYGDGYKGAHDEIGYTYKKHWFVDALLIAAITVMFVDALINFLYKSPQEMWENLGLFIVFILFGGMIYGAVFSRIGDPATFLVYQWRDGDIVSSKMLSSPKDRFNKYASYNFNFNSDRTRYLAHLNHPNR